jgi:hypothetical protein
MQITAGVELRMNNVALGLVVALQLAVLVILARRCQPALAAFYVTSIVCTWLLAFTLVSTHIPLAMHLVWLVPVVWFIVVICLTKHPRRKSDGIS